VTVAAAFPVHHLYIAGYPHIFLRVEAFGA
jgi:hypothetical protein